MTESRGTLKLGKALVSFCRKCWEEKSMGCFWEGLKWGLSLVRTLVGVVVGDGLVGMWGLRKMSFGRSQPPLALPAADTPQEHGLVGG